MNNHIDVGLQPFFQCHKVQASSSVKHCQSVDCAVGLSCDRTSL